MAVMSVNDSLVVGSGAHQINLYVAPYARFKILFNVFGSASLSPSNNA